MENKEINLTISNISKEKLKPCCACPETRKQRDECLFKFDENYCKDLMKKHIECMKKEGFIISDDSK